MKVCLGSGAAADFPGTDDSFALGELPLEGGSAPAVGQPFNLTSSLEARYSAVRYQLRNHTMVDFIASQRANPPICNEPT